MSNYRVFILLLFIAGPFVQACTSQGKSFVPAIPGYNVAGKQVILLKKELIEISGIFYLPDGNLAAINDEEGKLFMVNSSTGAFTHTRFGKKRDYEDVVKAGNYYYVLESNGNLHRVPEGQAETEEELDFPEKKYIEFESLYFDAPNNRLILLSKDQRKKKEKDEISAYAFDLATSTFSEEPVFTISLHDVQIKMKDNIAEFKPSAAAIHPVLNKLFVIASVGKALLQCSLDGKAEKVYYLNPDQFPQPEGITFAPNGDMYISNEGVNGKADIIKFPYSK